MINLGEGDEKREERRERGKGTWASFYAGVIDIQ